MSTGLYLALVNTLGEQVVAPGTPELWMSPHVTQDDFISPTITPDIFQLGLDVDSDYVVGERPVDTLVEYWNRIRAWRVTVQTKLAGQTNISRIVDCTRKDGAGGELTDELPLFQNVTPEILGRFEGLISEEGSTFPLPLALKVQIWLCFIGEPPEPSYGTIAQTAPDSCIYNPGTNLWFPSLVIRTVTTYNAGDFLVETVSYPVTPGLDESSLSFTATIDGMNLTMVATVATAEGTMESASLSAVPFGWFGWADNNGGKIRYDSTNGKVVTPPQNWP